jgi:hypothetical protein
MRNDGGFMKLLPLIASACLATSAVAAGAPNIEQQVGRAVGHSLQGDAAAAVKTLAAH